MSDLAMTRFLATKAVGAQAWVSPEDLQLSEEQFHSAVKGWLMQHGGPGFSCLDTHRESQTGHRRYDRVKVQRTS